MLEIMSKTHFIQFDSKFVLLLMSDECREWMPLVEGLSQTSPRLLALTCER